jgi:hypothetical protein
VEATDVEGQIDYQEDSGYLGLQGDGLLLELELKFGT